uniref:Cytochrome b5 heme-binding domain-containing protein n=2 Tax=Ditylum brightwellii TaxID=49249 RepID=A0A7S4VWP8_9STRA
MVRTVLHAVWIGLTAIMVTRFDANTFFMRFFRDLARSKARRRLYGNKHALVPMLLGLDQPLMDVASSKTKDDEDAEKQMVSLTLEDLASFTGASSIEDDDEYDESNSSPLYLSIMGRIYDVTAGSNFYGPGGQYHSFVGKDATRAFATGCLKEECMVSTLDGLSEKELKEIDRWVELYETHDKYTFVGTLVEDVVDQILELEVDTIEQLEEEEEEVVLV